MRDLFFKLFSDTPFGVGEVWHIQSFNIWHFVYIILIFGGIIGAAFYLKNKPATTSEKVLRTLAFLLVFSYLTDYFVHDFVYADFNEATGEYTRGDLNMDKLPFHICTVLCPIIAFTQFNKRFQRFIRPVAVLAVVGPMMYLCYPSTGVGGEAWCYRVVQTMFFHGVEMAWGALAIATGKTTLKWKTVWQPAVLLVCITLWAKLGATMLEYNWFFLRENPFGIEALNKPWLLPIITPLAIYIIAIAIYGINSGVQAIAKKLQSAKPAPVFEGVAEFAPADADGADDSVVDAVADNAADGTADTANEQANE